MRGCVRACMGAGRSTLCEAESASHHNGSGVTLVWKIDNSFHKANSLFVSTYKIKD
jgi:hypothetical protein